MSVPGILSYLLGAAFGALVVTALGLGLARLAGRRPGRAGVALLLSTGFVIFLGLSPFPLPSEVVCKTPLLRPFHSLDGYALLWRREAPLSAWLGNLSIITPVANLAVFVLVGACLAGLTRRFSVALAFGLAVSGFIEVSQLSGLYGIYPCAYRHFDVDDLILNGAGLLAGFALALRWQRRAARPHRRAAR